jgi:Co/Zn/Cd efflux system component
VPGGWLIVVAAIGILINAEGAAAVFRLGREDANMRASFLYLRAARSARSASWSPA